MVVPATDKTLAGPRTAVSSACDWLPKIAVEFLPPVRVIDPPGAKMSPSTVTVSPTRETAALGSVVMTAPVCSTTFPRATSRLVNGSVTLTESKPRLTGGRTPTGARVGVSDTASLSVEAMKLCATGAMTVPAATTREGTWAAADARPSSVKLVNPPVLKKSGANSREPATVVVPPTWMSGARRVSEPPAVPP